MPDSQFLTDRYAETDQMNFGDFKPALLKILRTASTPITVGVFGAWGTGKTSLLKQLQGEIDGQGLDKHKTMWFTAWKYDRSGALWRAFILRVLDSIFPRHHKTSKRLTLDGILNGGKLGDLSEATQRQYRAVEKLAQLEQTVYSTVSISEQGGLSFDRTRMAQETAKLAGYLPLHWFGLKSVAEAFHLEPDLAAALQREIRTHTLDQLTGMEQFEATFGEALDLVLGDNGRLVIFVDDLDRCLPEKAIEVLEAIKLFLEVPGTVFVLGLDAGVIEKGIEARYRTLFQHVAKTADGKDADVRAELPITGSSYLQKLIQIPFYLPPLTVDDLGDYIKKNAPQVDELTRTVFARGLLPNPRQVKRALNIYTLLDAIRVEGEASERLAAGMIKPALLAKTVVIQIQYPELYAIWRTLPLIVQMLEEEYSRNPVTDRDMAEGIRKQVRQRPKAGADETETGEEREPGLLEQFLTDRRKYALLAQMLNYPPVDHDQASEARFAGLSRREMQAYVRLAGAAEREQPTTTTVETVALPEALLAEMLNSEPAISQDALARFQESEEGKQPGAEDALAAQLLHIATGTSHDAAQRVGAGRTLAALGDPRFDPAAFHLPRITSDEPLLGFVHVPGGRFMLGSDPAVDSQARDSEQPQIPWEVDDFYLARYPVTGAQWKRYLATTGTTPQNTASTRDPDNHPVRWISWREAVAYAAWLDGQLRQSPATPAELRDKLNAGWAVRLPAEAEWEYAARYPDNRLYPWASAPVTPNHANYAETGLGTTSAVGCFPLGASQLGLLDLSGNVWEWTATKWQGSYKDYANDTSLEGAEPRVRRGGSFKHVARDVRAAFRHYDSPDSLSSRRGVRVAVGVQFVPAH